MIKLLDIGHSLYIQWVHINNDIKLRLSQKTFNEIIN